MRKILIDQIREYLKSQPEVNQVYLIDGQFQIIEKGKTVKVNLPKVKELIRSNPDITVFQFFNDSRKFDMQLNQWVGSEPAISTPIELKRCNVKNIIVTDDRTINSFMNLCSPEVQTMFLNNQIDEQDLFV